MDSRRDWTHVSRARYYLLLLDLLRGSVENGSCLLGVHPIDENQTTQPRGEPEWPCVKDLLFCDDGTFIHHWPQIEHAQYVQRALMIRYYYARPILL